MPPRSNRTDPMAPFARALADAAAGRRARFYFCHEDGRRHEVDAALLVRPFLFPAVERAVLERLQAEIPRGGSVLDIGCGAGRHTRWLREQGYGARGIDESPAVCSVAQALGAPVEERSVWDLPEDIPYDAAILLNNSIGLVGFKKHMPTLLKRLALVTPIVALDSADFGNDVPSARVQIEYRGDLGPWFEWLHLSRAELSEAAEKAGWKVEVLAAGDGPHYGALLKRQPAT